MAGVEARACGTCTLCCKVLGISELRKPPGRWCPHCAPGRGCKTYDERPQECRTFACLWLTQDFMGEDWKPERSKFVLCADNGGARLLIHTDPGAPAAWRRAPYYDQIKAWARAAAEERRQVIVRQGDSFTVVLPDRDVPLGRVEEGERIITREHRENGQLVLTVEKLPPLPEVS